MDTPGIGWVHSTGPQSQSSEAREGTHRETQSAQATGPVRTTEQDWQTFLRARAEKANTQKHYRFRGLYRMINQDVLRLCFYRLRKDAASGVDKVTYQDYEKNLEKNLADLAGRLRRKAYRARLVRRRYIPKGNGKLRPLGIPTVLEDKLLQMAATQILTWSAVNRLLTRFQVPRPRIVENKGHMPCQFELSFCQHLVNFPRRLMHPLAHARAS